MCLISWQFAAFDTRTTMATKKKGSGLYCVVPLAGDTSLRRAQPSAKTPWFKGGVGGVLSDPDVLLRVTPRVGGKPKARPTGFNMNHLFLGQGAPSDPETAAEPRPSKKRRLDALGPVPDYLEEQGQPSQPSAYSTEVCLLSSLSIQRLNLNLVRICLEPLVMLVMDQMPAPNQSQMLQTASERSRKTLPPTTSCSLIFYLSFMRWKHLARWPAPPVSPGPEEPPPKRGRRGFIVAETASTRGCCATTASLPAITTVRFTKWSNGQEVTFSGVAWRRLGWCWSWATTVDDAPRGPKRPISCP